MQSIIDRAVENYRRKQFLQDANADYAKLKKNSNAWKRELAERKVWDKTLSDGLEDE